MMFRPTTDSLPFISSLRCRDVRRRARAHATRPALFEPLERRELLSVTGPTATTPGAASAVLTVAALAPTTTTLDASAHSTVYGQGLTLTAFVTGGGAGTVSFSDAGGSILGSAPVVAGKAKFYTATLAPGMHSLTATYSGSATHAASVSAALAQSVSPARTTVKLDSSAGVVINPILRPNRVVVVVMENSASNAIGDAANMPYFNQLAASGLVYDNSHGLNGSDQIFGQMNYLALYSGSTQGITDDFSGYSFNSPNLAKSLHDNGLSFTGYVESLPAAGDTTTYFAPDAPGSIHTDAYARRYNPIAQFTDVGAGKTNADVNKPFSSFPSDLTGLPTVSYVIPNRLHNTHGSNNAPPFANDPAEYDNLRRSADAWLQANLDGYLQWAKANNSLLIVTTEDADRNHNYAGGGTTIVTGDPRLFVSGVNGTYVTPYNVLRTIEDMYGLAPIGDTVTANRLDTDALGRLSPAGPSANALISGQGVTYTANVSPLAPATGTPGGTIQFLVDGANFGDSVPITGGAASLTVPGLFAGQHAIEAVYAGQLGYDGSRATLAQPVDQNTTSVSLTSSASSAGAGQSVTFTAIVSAAAPGAGVPTGVVIFRSGATAIGSAAIDATGRAILTTSSLATGTHEMTAHYAGDANHGASVSAAISQIVNANATVVALATSAPSAKVGEPITLTATVSGPGPLAPTGTVTFKDGSIILGTAEIDIAGKAAFTTGMLGLGDHFISATYAGDANFAAGVSPVLTQTIAANPTTTTLASSNISATAGQTVTFTATVAIASGSRRPGGSVAFFNGPARIGTATIDASGKAVFATALLTVGTHPITAVYSGDANFSGSASAVLTQTIVEVPAPAGPANDKFVDGIRLTGSLATASGSNVDATRESGEPRHGSNGGGKSVWWTWTAPASGIVTIDTLGSSFKTVLGVYTGTSATRLRKVSGISTSVSGAAAFGFFAKAKQSYRIAVDGVGGATGNINLRVKTWSGTPARKTDWKSLWKQVERDDDKKKDRDGDRNDQDDNHND